MRVMDNLSFYDLQERDVARIIAQSISSKDLQKQLDCYHQHGCSLSEYNFIEDLEELDLSVSAGDAPFMTPRSLELHAH